MNTEIMMPFLYFDHHKNKYIVVIGDVSYLQLPNSNCNGFSATPVNISEKYEFIVEKYAEEFMQDWWHNPIEARHEWRNFKDNSK